MVSGNVSEIRVNLSHSIYNKLVNIGEIFLTNPPNLNQTEVENNQERT